jgi:hypothetical protein
MARKNVYMNEALEHLEEEVKGTETNFSSRLGEIVGRYQILLELEELPKLTPIEQDIMNNVIWGNIIDRRKVRGLHLDILDAELGTHQEREALSTRIAECTIGQRLKLIEQVNQI